MFTFHKIVTAGAVALSLAAASLTATTPALAHGGGDGFSRDGGHAHVGGRNFAGRGFEDHHFGEHRDGRFAFHDRNRMFFDDNDDDYPGYCQPEWRLNQYGHRVLVEVCP